MPCVCNPTNIIELVNNLKKVSLTENTKLMIVVAHTYNLSNQKFEIRASTVPGQPGLQNETVPQRNKNI